MSSTVLRQRTSVTGVSSRAIAEELRRNIIGGELVPGAQLPTRADLEQQFGTTSVTIQRALDRLVRDEFIYVNGRRGTYVSLNPPHLSRYALVFRHDPDRDSERWTRFFSSMAEQAVRLDRLRERRISTYTSVDGHIDSPNFNTLIQEVLAQRLAGIIFADGISGLEHTPLVESPALPKVSVGRVDALNCTTLQLDETSFIHRALDYFQQRGRKRLAIISAKTPTSEFGRVLSEAVSSRKFLNLPYWNQVCVVAQASAARTQAHLLMKCVERPDALLITDDNLVEHATAGLIEAGVTVPSDVEIVAHANFPNPTHSVVDAQRLGYDTTEILSVALASIDTRRRQEQAPEVSEIRAVFLHELGSYSASTRSSVIENVTAKSTTLRGDMV